MCTKCTSPCNQLSFFAVASSYRHEPSRDPSEGIQSYTASISRNLAQIDRDCLRIQFAFISGLNIRKDGTRWERELSVALRHDLRLW